MLKKLFAKLTGSGKKRAPKKRAASAPKKKPAAPKKSLKKPARASSKKRSARPKQKSAAKPAGSKRPAPGDSDKAIGEVVAFFRIPVVAVVKLKQGSLKVGDTIWIYGHTTSLKLTISSMQINHKPVAEIRKGAEAGIKITSRARRGDRIYLLPG